ncbi:MAG: HAMP domain-containing sensor histidine kinase, partial [Bacilli bacterium]|nr:HAMP domain-containing sensor histidine kinase [Bacilli bacterium]
VIFYQEDGEVFAYDKNLLNYLIENNKEFNSPEVTESEILEALQSDLFKYNRQGGLKLEKANNGEEYYFQTLSFSINKGANLSDCKLLLMVNGEIQSRNLVLRVYSFASLLMFVFAFFASLFLSSMSIKPIKTALDKQLVFVSDASHELRTPLAIVRNRLENILTKSNKTVYEVSDDIAISLKEITRLSKLTDDLLTLAHSDNEDLELNLTEFNLMDLIKTVSLPFSEMAEIENKDFVISGENLLIYADKGKISQLLIILLDNALKYTIEKETVSILIKQNGNDVYLYVKDTGIGIDEEMKTHAFERFYRADKTRSRETGGNGLGLSIAKTIVELHRGHISMDNNYPKGTKIKIVLPKALRFEKK